MLLLIRQQNMNINLILHRYLKKTFTDNCRCLLITQIGDKYFKPLCNKVNIT